MNQTQFNRRLNVNEVRRLTDNRVQVWASEGDSHLTFRMFTSAIDVPRVNDDILVTITSPAPSDGGPPG